uniref:Zinc finger protein RFP-like n=1 Tax=Gopherus agassizii TaxID=38772 RepID=A0A452I6M3_9SAUR
MASANPAKMFLGELACSVCLDYFKDPVCLDCGHNFCHACITQCWEGLSTNFHCPECRETFSQRNFKPNRQLRNIVEASRKLTLESTKEPEVERVCEKHKRASDVFCQVEEMPICMVCHLSQDHREHTVVPIEETAEDYKVRNHGTVKVLHLRKSFNHPNIFTDNLSVICLLNSKLETEKQKIVSEFQHLSQFLKEQERLLLAQLEELNKEIEKRRDEYVAKLSEELSSFSSLISEMEEKCQLPASEFLQVRQCSVTDMIRPCPGAELCPSRSDSLSAANVTLDPDTAHPYLIVSADRKSVRRGDTWQDLPSNPERFDTELCVLGCEGFTSGRHYWEIERKEGEVCIVGVARESVSRKGDIDFNPERGIWAVLCNADRYWALTSPDELSPLSLRQAPRRIRVYLDYEPGQVAFFDAGTGDRIFTFPPASFAGERIRPLFSGPLLFIPLPSPPGPCA